jgi:beta-phosphoglucomutase
VNHRLRGVSRAESLRRIYRHNGRPVPPESEFNAQMEKKNARYVQLVSGMTPADILPGSIGLLTALRTEGIRCAIASASKNTGTVLRVTGLAKHVDGVADGNQAKKSKPDPEVFLLAANSIGCAPAACIGVEDAESGVEAIRNAGMVSIGIGPAAAKADYAVGGVAQLDVATLRRVFSRANRPRSA